MNFSMRYVFTVAAVCVNREIGPGSSGHGCALGGVRHRPQWNPSGIPVVFSQPDVPVPL